MANMAIIAEIGGRDMLSPAVHSATASLNGLETAGTRVNRAMGAMAGAAATAMVAAGAALVGGVALGIKAAGDLEQAVANISTIKPEIDTSQVFTALNEMQTRVPQSAAQLGDALYNIFSSIDVSVEQGVALTEKFARGAVGAQTDAQTFGTAVLGVMNAYGLAVQDADHVSDVFFNTVKLGVVTGQELAGNFGIVTSAAKAAGVNIDTLGGLIAGVTKEGGPAAQNINNLANMLMKINTTEAQGAMLKLGVTTVDTTGRFREIPDVLTDLKGALAELTEAERLAAMQKIFPDLQARQGAQVIMSQLDFVKGAINSNIHDSGAAAEAFRKMNDTFNSQLKILQNSFNSILTTIGARLLPSLTPLMSVFSRGLPGAFDKASDALDDLTDQFSEWFANLFGIDTNDITAPFDRISDALTVGLPNALAEVRTRFAGLETFIVDHWQGALVGAFGAVGVAMAVSAGMGILAWLPVVVPLAAVGVAIAVLYEAWQQNLGGIQEQTHEFYDGTIKPVFSDLVNWFKERIPGAMEWLIQTGWPTLQKAGQTFVDFLKGPAAAAFEDVRKWLADNLPPAFNTLTNTVLPALGRAFQTLTNDVLPAAGAALDTLSRWVQNAWDWLVKLSAAAEEKGVYDDLWVSWNNLQDIAGTLAGAVASVFDPTSQLHKALFGEAGLTGSSTSSADGLKSLSGEVRTFTEDVKSALSPLNGLVQLLATMNDLVTMPKTGQPLIDVPKILRERGIDTSGTGMNEEAPRGGILNPTGPRLVPREAPDGPEFGPPVPETASGPPINIGVSGVDIAGHWQQRAAAIAESVGLDSNLFVSQIQQESGFAEDVILGRRRSSAGAQGIAQIMPATAAGWGVDPLIPEDALQAAATNMKRYIDGYLEETGGDYATSVEMALAAYNAGGGNLARYGLAGVKDPSFARGETKDYIENILGRLQPFPESPSITGGASSISGAFEPVNLSLNQVDWASGMAGARNICGPYLAALFADSVGRPPTPQEAAELAQKYAWSPTEGMLMNDKVDDLANAFIKQANPGSGMRVEEIQGSAVGGIGGLNQLAQQNLAEGDSMVGFNTQDHYFAADQYDAESGKYHVGATGTVMKNYAADAGLAGVDLNWLSVEQIDALGRGLTSVLTLAGQAGGAMTEMVDGSLTPLGEAAVATAVGVVDATGQMVVGFDEFGNAIYALPDAMAGTGEAFDTLTGAAGVMGEATVGAVDEMGNAITGLPEIVGEPILGAVDAIAPLNDSLLGIGESGAEMANVIGETTGAMQEQATAAVETMATDTVAGAEGMNTGVVDAVTTMTDGSVELMDSMGNTVAESAGEMGDQTTDAVSEMGDTVSGTIDDMGSTVTDSAGEMGDQVVDAVGTMGDDVSDSTSEMGDQVVDATGEMGDQTSDAVSEMGDTVSESAGDMGDQVSDSVSEMGDTVSESAGEMGDQAGSSAEDMQDMVTGAAEMMADEAAEAAEDMSSDIQDILAGLADEAGGLGSDIGDSLGEGIESGLDSAVAAVRSSARRIIREAETAASAAAEIASPSKLFARLGRQLSLGVAEGILDSLPVVSAAASELVAVPDMAYGGLGNGVVPRGVGSAGSDGIDYERLAKAITAAMSGAGKTVNVYPAQSSLTEEGLLRELAREELRERW